MPVYVHILFPHIYWAGTKLMAACLLVSDDWGAVVGDRVWAVTP